MERLHNIKAAVRGLSAREPDTDETDMFWHKVDRNDPNYFRLVRGEEPVADVWLETEARFDRAGDMCVSAKVVYYDCTVEHKADETTIFGTGFDGLDQPREQTFLNNIPAYQEQIHEQVEEYAEWAEHDATADAGPA